MARLILVLWLVLSAFTVHANLVENPTLDEFFGKDKTYEYGVDYPMVMFHTFGIKYCATIHFFENKTGYRMDYAFKAWRPAPGTQACDFQNQNTVDIPEDQRAWCVKDGFENFRFFTNTELAAVKNGSRSIELTSPVGDDKRFALSRCFNYQEDGSNFDNPLLVDLKKAQAAKFNPSAPSPGNTDRDNEENVQVIASSYQPEYTAAYGPPDLTQTYGVLSLEMTNGFTYIIFDDQDLN